EIQHHQPAFFWMHTACMLLHLPDFPLLSAPVEVRRYRRRHHAHRVPTRPLGGPRTAIDSYLHCSMATGCQAALPTSAALPLVHNGSLRLLGTHNRHFICIALIFIIYCITFCLFYVLADA